MKWVVAFCCFPRLFLSQPTEFLSKPKKRAQPTWIVGVVQAPNKSAAFDAALDAWDRGLLSGQQRGHCFANWYVAPLANTIEELCCRYATRAEVDDSWSASVNV